MPTNEERAWPEEARVLSLMANGFSYGEAMHMSPRDARRYAAIAAAWSIPSDERDGVVRAATAADVGQLA